jgi:hypothetical protein
LGSGRAEGAAGLIAGGNGSRLGGPAALTLGGFAVFESEKGLGIFAPIDGAVFGSGTSGILRMLGVGGAFTGGGGRVSARCFSMSAGIVACGSRKSSSLVSDSSNPSTSLSIDVTDSRDSGFLSCSSLT